VTEFWNTWVYFQQKKVFSWYYKFTIISAYFKKNTSSTNYCQSKLQACGNMQNYTFLLYQNTDRNSRSPILFQKSHLQTKVTCPKKSYKPLKMDGASKHSSATEWFGILAQLVWGGKLSLLNWSGKFNMNLPCSNYKAMEKLQ